MFPCYFNDKETQASAIKVFLCNKHITHSFHIGEEVERGRERERERERERKRERKREREIR